jgi:hypothetical protein
MSAEDARVGDGDEGSESESGEIARVEDSGVAEPLTPALSQGEREKGQSGDSASEAKPAVEEALTSAASQEERAKSVKATHPSGEQFFRGGEELSDAEAEETARKQLERCGLLRKQRV